MGNGGRHQDAAYSMWGQLSFRFDEWITFGRGGQDYMEYDDKEGRKNHPGGKPLPKREKVEELKALIKTRHAEASPVVLIGFSAGSYLAMTVALELDRDGYKPGKLAVFCMGHVLFAQDRMNAECSIPGVIIVGQEEQKLKASLAVLSTDPGTNYKAEDRGWQVSETVTLDGLQDELEAMPADACGAYAGRSAELCHLSRTFPKCIVCTAGQSAHSIRDYAWAMRTKQLYCVTGNRPPSNSSSSSSSRSSSV